MALITSYSSLQTAIADWLNRSDLTSVIPNFIQNAEDKLRMDPEQRVRKLTVNSAFQLGAEVVNLPNDLDQIEALYHDGPTFFGPIEIVPADVLPHKLAEIDTTGVPAFATRIGSSIRLAPVPDATYTVVLSYWIKLDSLSDTVTTNWLLLEAPSIYLYAALLESAPYLKDDARVAMWHAKLNELIEGLRRRREREQYSGRLVRRPQVLG